MSATTGTTGTTTGTTGTTAAKRKNGPDATQFCKIWQDSATMADFCKTTGMDELTASQRATSYRKKGVALKKFERGGRKKIDVNALNAMLGVGVEEKADEKTVEKTTETGLTVSGS